MRFSLALLLGALLAAVPVHAQTTFASISGRVADPSGAVVPGVTIQATNSQTGYEYRAQSNESGAYTIPQLLEGTYTLRASATGFQEFVAREIQLASRDQRRIDIQMQIGAVETVVEVSAGATLIETETARIGDSKSANVLKSLPINTRSLYGFLALSPAVVDSAVGAFRRFAGSQVNQSDQSIDGITVSNGYDGTQVSPLVDYIESYQEVRVDMANNSADIGAVGQVTVVSKGGSNELHGNVFDYYVTPWFRARNPFAAARSTGISHQPGFSVGGPIVVPKLYDGHNKTFFFTSFETSRGSAPQQLLNPTVPLASWREGDFSGVSQIRDPFTGDPLSNNQIPASRLNDVSVKYQNRFYPLPNVGDTSVLRARNYNELKIREFTPSTYFTARLDHRFSDKSFFFARFTFNRSHNRPWEANLPTLGQRWQTRNTRATNASYTHSITPTLISESRFGHSFNNNPRSGPVNGTQLAQELGLVGLAEGIPDINGVLDVSWSGIGLQRITQEPWRFPGFRNLAEQFQQHVNWYGGKHSLKTGFMLTWVNFQDQQAPAALFGQLTFSNRFTGHPYSDFLYGIPTNASRAFPPRLLDRSRFAYDFFITDEYKVTPRLTLNLGLRYELHPSWSEASGLQAAFDIDEGVIVVPDGALAQVSPLLPTKYVGVVEASTLGYPSGTLMKTDRNNFAPRIGLAWRPFGADTVVRAGYGIFYDVVPNRIDAGGVPFVINEPQFVNPRDNPVVVFPRVFPATGTGGPSTVSIPAGNRVDMRIPYSMQYNVTLEHQRWDTGFRLSYVATNTRQGEWAYNYNQPVPDTNAFIGKARPYPRYPVINYVTNGAGHQYHSFNAEAQRNFRNGFSYQLSWVWARDIGDLDRETSPENAFDRARERGVTLDIPSHRFTSNFLYELPFGRGKKFGTGAGGVLNRIIGGWEISGILATYSNQFLTPLWTGPDPTGTRFTSSSTAPVVTIRPDHLRNGNLPDSQRSVDGWFDASAFARPQAGQFGTSAKGVIKGPGSFVLHGGLFKSIPFTERVRARIELTATNLPNHPNYSAPAMNISNAETVGSIGGVGASSELDQSGARFFRAGFRIEW